MGAALSVVPVPAEEDDPIVVGIVPVPVRDGRRGGVTGYIVQCQGGCGHNFRIAPRTLRDLRRDRRLPVCDECRRPSQVYVTDEHRRFWTERFSEAEIVSMGAAVNDWAADMGIPIQPAARHDLALAASAARRSR